MLTKKNLQNKVQNNLKRNHKKVAKQLNQEVV